jgi:spore coat polysaccharide biosynthesis protein SpsF (cytidylyltransferase family)
MNKIIEHALIVLQKQDDWMTYEEIRDEVKQLFPRVDVSVVFKYMDKKAHIGRDSKLGYRYYEPNELTNKVQECLDRGDDW